MDIPNETDIYYDLFSIRSIEDEIFYFEDIEVMHNWDIPEDNKSCTEIAFRYSYCDDIRFRSTLQIKSELIIDKTCMDILFAIGMCVLPWYYLGYYSDKIVVKEAVVMKCFLQDDMLTFWRYVYEQIILEFCYLNNLAYKSIQLLLERNRHCHCDIASSSIPVAQGLSYINGQTIASQDSLSLPLIVPIGGGKDSLVVWHLIKQQVHIDIEHAVDHISNDRDIILLYVADGPQEYHQHRRLQRILALTDSPSLVIQHDFHI